jgi:peptidylprolyl isomerase domain and WD repeat-containing protein 1
MGGKSSMEKISDPTLVCSAFKKNRFYMFSQREPEDPDD